MKRSQATETIRDWIHSGKLPRGVLLPPERTLAEELGVSRPTVRRAIEPLVQEGLLESQPGRGTLVPENPAAEGERRDWKLLALLLPDIANRFFSEVAESIEYAALQRGYQILLCNSRHQTNLEEFHIRQIVTHRVKGVILAHDPNQEVSGSLGLLRSARIPTVLLFSTAREAECDSVVLDDRAGVEQALRYLFSLGHKRIAFCRPLPGPQPHPRETHFLEFMNGDRTSYLLDVLDKSDDEIRARLGDLLSREDAPTACLAGNDNVALMLTKNLANLNIAVPDAFSVVGFDNLRFVRHLPVPLTTIDQPKQEMGRRAAELLFERIDAGSEMPYRQEVFTPHLVIRESCSVVPFPARSAPAIPAEVTRGSL
jgi:DNA-binding LacI/PurR family transcriptional regulator